MTLLLSDDDVRDIANALRPTVKAHLGTAYPFNQVKRRKRTKKQ